MAVSYTHLDAYKRQALDRAYIIFPADSKLKRMEYELDAIVLLIIDPPTLL